jgi:hypothetical protein
MKAVLHIGIEKTGTTAIQAFLTDNRKALLDCGYAYLESAGLPSNRKLASYCMDFDRHDDHHEMLGIIDAEPRKQWNQAFLNDFNTEIENLPSNVQCVVISCEQLHSRLVKESEIVRAKEALSQHFDDIEVIVYLRRQDQLATSLYSTALKCGHSFDTILPGVTAEDHYYNFQLLLSQWSHVFGADKMTVRLFDRSEMLNNDLLSDFFQSCDITDIPLSEMKQPGRQNESLEPKAQRFLHEANKQIPMMIDGKFNPLRARLTQHLEQQFSGKPRLPLRQEAEEFCGKFLTSNQAVAQQWFDRENLFTGDFSNYPDNRNDEQFSFEEGVQISSSLLNSMMKDELDTSTELLKQLQQHPEAGTRLIADYFAQVNPQLSNYLRQHLVVTGEKKVA